MPKYMLIDATGLEPRFYTEDVHGPLEIPVYGPTPDATADNPDPQPPVIGTEPNSAYPAGVVEVSDDVWQDFLGNQGRRKWNPTTKVFDAYTSPPPAPPVAYMTGGDVIDGMSPAQAAAQGVDVRDLVRIQAAPAADMVKSKIARVEKAAGLAAGTLVKQATATGGT